MRAEVVDPDLRSALDRLGPLDRISVIVRFDRNAHVRPLPGQDRALGRASVVNALKAQLTASLSAAEPILRDSSVSRRVELWAINGLALTAGSRLIGTLAAAPNVARISLDSAISEKLAQTGSLSTPEWNLEAIRVPELWAAGHTGAGVVVATLDSGADLNHQDLVAGYRGGGNSWFDPFGQHSTPYDRSGHGTQVLGLIVGGDTSGHAIGVAPDASWIAARIYDDSGNGTLSAIHEAFQWLLDPDGDPSTDDAPDVVNGSWDLANAGHCGLEFEQDLETLKAAQIAVVFSGGNYGPDRGTSVSPGNNPSAFAVGAIDNADLIAPFSSSGPSACGGAGYPEVVAPGVDVRTADLTFGGVFPDAYATVSGTSFAAPHLAGAMALLLSAHPGATVGALEQALQRTAIDLGAAGPDPRYGQGLVDLVAAEAALARLVAGAVVATTYTDEAEFLSAVSGLGTVAEGFEDDAAWGAARSPDALPAVASQGITWTSNHPANEISTSSGAARSGNWGGFSSPHGDQNVPNPTDFIEDGVTGTSDRPLAAVGGWFRGTNGGRVDVILDGDEANPIGLGPVDAAFRFYGVSVDGSFSSFEFRETEGTREDQKYVFIDDVTVALAGGGSVPTMDGVVAGVASLPGALGADWRSDLYLHNAAAVPATVELYFSTADGAMGPPATVAVGPDQTVTLEDAVASVFGAQGSGALFWRVVEGNSAGVLVSADTYNRVDAVKRYGQQVPGVRWSGAAPAGSPVLVPALAGRYRTNLGLATDGDCTAVVIRGYDRTGALAASRTMAVQPWSWIQLNSVFTRVFPELLPDPDNTPVAESLHRFEVTGVDGRVVAYTSIIDNRTGDGSYMLGQVPGVSGSQWLPGAAVIRGANGSDWRSDVILMSTAGDPAEVEVAFFPSGQDNGAPPDQRTIPAAVGESVFEGDILGALFGYASPAVGGLAVATPAAAPLLWMRTYTEEPAPGGGTLTYGQAIMPRASAGFIAAGGEGRVAGFSHDATTRANLILQNARTAVDGTRLPSTVSVELLAADGSVLHGQEYALLPGEYLQHNRFVDGYGAGPVRGASLRVRVLDQPAAGESGGVDAMVSEVNGNALDGTNDSRLIRAEVVVE